MTDLHLDWETKSKANIKHGADVYASDPSTFVLLGAYQFDDNSIDQWDAAGGEPMPSDLRDGLRDPQVRKIAFNAPFERWIAAKVLGIKTDPSEWYCVMALAYMFSFMGGLDMVAKQMSLRAQKDAEGSRLIRKFTMPQSRGIRWRGPETDPEDWIKFKSYNIDDVRVEVEMWRKLTRYYVPDWQWEVYHLDQIINDRGLPINVRFVQNAMQIAERRKHDLIGRQNVVTGLTNSNSIQQLLPWLQDRGFYHRDLQKDSIKKFLAEEEETISEALKNPDLKGVVSRPTWTEIEVRDKKGKPTTERIVADYQPVQLEKLPKINGLGEVEGDALITDEARQVLRMRLASSKNSTTKYKADLDGLSKDGRLRQCFQFAGASRTNRWAGRKIQPQNLPRTPKWLEPNGNIGFDLLGHCNELIEAGDYDGLGLYAGEHMEAVAGCVRSSIQAPEDRQLVVCDLSSIESVVIGWLTDCERLLNVFREGRDAYKDFATEMYSIPYSDVTKTMRTNSKPATLGAGYRLSGGKLVDGKKTGLWGYAENMGINLTKEESHRAVEIFRTTYKEIPQFWYAIEDTVEKAMLAGGRPVKLGPLTFQIKKPFLVVTLPSGRPMYYYKLKVEKQEFEGQYGPYTRTNITYMGKDQITQQWKRIESHGGKFIENFVQAIARDLLAYGMIVAHENGFNLIGHVHDELISEERLGDNRLTHEYLGWCMTKGVQERWDWTRTMPLGAEGYTDRVYRKD